MSREENKNGFRFPCKIEKMTEGRMVKEHYLSLERISALKDMLLGNPYIVPIPSHYSKFRTGERVVIKNQTFEIEHINDRGMLLKLIGIWSPEKEVTNDENK